MSINDKFEQEDITFYKIIAICTVLTLVGVAVFL